MKRLWVSLVVFPAAAMADVETLHVGHGQYCAYNQNFLPAQLRTFTSDNAARQALRSIMQHTGVNASKFELRAAFVDNAAALFDRNTGRRFILYNEQFMQQITDRTRNEWSGISILAHEVGHHFNGHNLRKSANRQERLQEELEADQFSGFILRKMGASLDSALATVRTLPLQASSKHPGRNERINAVRKGWVEAEGLPFKRESTPSVQTSSRNQLPAEINLDHGMQLVRIPAGGFIMGDDSSLEQNEKPAHRVTISRPFYMGETEVTFNQYDAYANAAGKTKPSDEGWGRGTRPVINVSWNDAQGYVKWLTVNNSQGLHCRLPTEAEWEYAAKGGKNTKYGWGNTIGNNRANCDGCGSQWDNKQTAPVGSFPKTSFGLHDMHGNVWEWVQDLWSENYQGATVDGSNWESEAGASVRVLRGGSWLFTPNDVRSALRHGGSLDYRFVNIGFRVVCSPPSDR